MIDNSGFTNSVTVSFFKFAREAIQLYKIPPRKDRLGVKSELSNLIMQ